MATKKPIKPDREAGGKAEEEIFSGEYFYALGKRKSAVAQVRLYPTKKTGKKIMINGKNPEVYFPVFRLQTIFKSPLTVTGQENNFSINAKVFGGGTSSQADALRLGIARALVKCDVSLKKSLKDYGYLTRDARVVERKKPGLKKARRAPQWAKR